MGALALEFFFLSPLPLFSTRRLGYMKKRQRDRMHDRPWDFSMHEVKELRAPNSDKSGLEC